jgi:hypothetical protein
MMSLSADEIKAIDAEIQHISSTKKMLARHALLFMLNLIKPSFSILSVELFRQYLSRIKASEGIVKVFYSIFFI